MSKRAHSGQRRSRRKLVVGDSICGRGRGYDIKKRHVFSKYTMEVKRNDFSPALITSIRSNNNRIANHTARNRKKNFSDRSSFIEWHLYEAGPTYDHTETGPGILDEWDRIHPYIEDARKVCKLDWIENASKVRERRGKVEGYNVATPPVCFT